MIPRKCNISDLLKKKQSLLLLGPRGSGKTTLIRNALAAVEGKILQIDLLKGEFFRAFVGQPFLLRNQAEAEIQKHGFLTLFIDEVQKIPELLDEVHSLIEEFPKKIVFIGSGSSARKLKKSGANLLAGRAILRKIFPFTSEEVDIEVMHALRYGTLPKIYDLKDDDLAKEFLKTYVDVYLREEIQQEAIVRKFETFSRFLDLAGQYNGEPVNFSKLAKQLKLTTKTVQGYFQILVDTWLVTSLSGWSESVKKQLMAAPKFYFFDVGVLNAVNGEIDIQVKTESFRFGRLFETFIINEVIRACYYRGLDLRFNYWRTNHGKEVDLVISNPKRQPLYAIEIKSALEVSSEDLDALHLFAEDYPEAKLICIYRGAIQQNVDGVEILPWQSAVKAI